MDISEWLRSLGLERYETAFIESDITIEVLPDLTAEDLKEIGIATVGHRRRLLAAIAALRGIPSQQPAESGGGERVSVSTTERRRITVLFCDIVGSTRLSERLDPEDLRETLTAYQAAVTAAVARQQGHVARFVGDGVLAYFGWPNADEEHAESAVRAGLAVIQAVRMQQLSVRIGIASGLVVASELIGVGAAQTVTAVGETPNLAARLQGLAEANAIVMSESTRQLLGRLFVLADLGLQTMAGFAKPQQAWRVLGESTTLSRFEALRSEASPLIGRDEELELLLRRWQQAVSGDGSLVLLSGEPGIGKSRLVAALAERASSEPHLRLRYFCSPYHQDSALHPIIVQLEQASGFERQDTDLNKLSKLQKLFPSSEHNATEFGLVAELLSLPNCLAELNLGPKQKLQMLFKALLRQLTILADRQPVLMVFEDLHWADPTSRELLVSILRQVKSLRMMIIVTYRPEFQPSWGNQANVTVLALSRLDERDGARLVRSLTGAVTLAQNILDSIVGRADGIPLFVEELTRVVLETTEHNAHSVLTSIPPASTTIPATLHASLTARLDRLGPVAKEIAQVAAIIGREFSYEMIEHAAEVLGPELRQGLDRLVEAGLLFCRGVPPQSHYVFKHSLLQDAAYGMLIRNRRKLLHGRVAQVIEEHVRGIVEREPEVLAHHLSEAGRLIAATCYWLAAGRRAARRSANFEAINHLRRGIETSRGIEDLLKKDRLELALQLALGPALMATQGFTSLESATAYRRAQALAEQLGEDRGRFAATWGLWMFAATNGGASPPQFEDIFHFVDTLFFVADQSDDQELRLQAYHAAWGTTVWMGDSSATCSHVRHGLALYDREKHRGHAQIYGGHDPAVCGYAQLAIALWLQGYPEQARQSICEGLDLAEELGHAPSTGHALWLSASIFQLRGEFKEVLGCSERLVSIGREHGLPFYHGIGAMMHGAALAGLGELGTGILELRRNVEEFDNSKAKMMMGFYYSILAEMELRAGYTTLAFQAFEKAVGHSNGFGNEFWRAGMLCIRGDLLAASDKYLEAEQSYQEALEVARRQCAKSLELRAAMQLSRLWHGAGRGSEAKALLGPIYDWFTEGFDTADLRQAKVLLMDFG